MATTSDQTIILEMSDASRRNPHMPASNAGREDTSSVDGDSLAAVVTASQNGDLAAHRKLYDSCHENVFRLAVRMVGLQDAADVTQHTIDEIYVMKMPCCTCIQCLCRRGDGTTIAIFEHDDEELDWFGDRPETEVNCNDTRCSLVELDDGIAATWRRGKRFISVVGARDTTEVERLVAWFDEPRRLIRP